MAHSAEGLSAEALKPVFHFFNQLLRGDTAHILEQEYPLVFCPETRLIELSSMNPQIAEESEEEASSTLFCIRHEGELAAGLVALRRRVRTLNDRMISCAFVGSVVTHPQFRNQGFQKILFQVAEDLFRRQGVDLLVLWSNQLEFYQKLGFQLAGLQGTWSSSVNVDLGVAPTSHTGLAADQSFRSEWFESFQRKRLTVQRSQDEMKKLLRIPKMRIAWTDRAYTLLGKGEDFEGVCHEWAGPPSEVLACLERLRLDCGPLRILSPGFTEELDELGVLQGLASRNYESRLEYLGLFKALQRDFVMEDLDPERLKLPFFIWGLDSI